jgi:hypothetical protein
VFPQRQAPRPIAHGQELASSPENHTDATSSFQLRYGADAQESHALPTLGSGGGGC